MTVGGSARRQHRATSSLSRPQAQVRHLRHGFKFRSLILRSYNLQVVPPTTISPDPLKHALLWISFFSAVAKPSACLVKLSLDHFFSGSSSFAVLHYQENIFLALVSSEDVLNEIIQRSPVSPPGITLVLSSSLLAARSASVSIFESPHGPNLGPKDPDDSSSSVTRDDIAISILGRPPTLPPPPPASQLLHLFNLRQDSKACKCAAMASTRGEGSGAALQRHLPLTLTHARPPSPPNTSTHSANRLACSAAAHTPSPSSFNANLTPSSPSVDPWHAPALSPPLVHS